MATTANRVFSLLAVVLASCLAIIGSHRLDREPPRRTPTKNADETQREISAQVDQALCDAWQSRPTSQADTLLISRRLSLALVGSIPSLEEIRWIEARPGGSALDDWTDRLLEDPRFNDYFAERLARAFVPSLPAQLFFTYRRNRFVSWLSDQMARRPPYDRMVWEMLTAEGVWMDKPAVNFVTSHERDPVLLAGRTTRAFLGLRLDCAQCHDHPFARWKQSDFRGLAAFFSETQLGFFGVRDEPSPYRVSEEDGMVGEIIEPVVPFDPSLDPARGRKRERLANWVISPSNPFFAKAAVNRFWTLLIGDPLTAAVDDLESPEKVPDVLDILADDFRDQGHDLRRLIRNITATAAFRAKSEFHSPEQPADHPPFRSFPVRRLRSDQLAGSILQSSQLQTMNGGEHWIFRFVAFIDRFNFVEEFGDRKDEELEPASGNLPQRLLMMNGNVVNDRGNRNLFSTFRRLSAFSPSDEKCVETAYLVCLTRRPDPEELEKFSAMLKSTAGKQREQVVADMLWSLVNSTEFAWNH
ncbi:MAG: DUF1553 domain-containing protein [Planctomycetota bacterium]